MMRPQIFLAMLLTVSLSTAMAAPLDVSKGFAGAKWGQSPEEVAKETGAKIDEGFAADSEIPTVFYTKTNADQTVETLYTFLDGKLATITRSVKITNANGFSDGLIRDSFDLGEGISFNGNANFPARRTAPENMIPMPPRTVPGNMIPLPPTRRIIPSSGGRQYTFSLTSIPVTDAVGKKYADKAKAKFETEDLPKFLE